VRFDAAVDEPTAEYLEIYAFNALNFLAPPSWRQYLPRLIEYALKNIASSAPGTMAIDGDGGVVDRGALYRPAVGHPERSEGSSFSR
jgi:hypothetical protein